MKKIRFLIVIVFIVGAFVIMQSSAPPPPPVTLDVDPRVKTYEQTPPDVKNIWVQKLVNQIGGKTMLVRIELNDAVCYDTLADTVNLYWGDLPSNKITFFDNATNGDNIANDGIFSAYVVQNIASFRSEILSRESTVVTSGGYIKFTGHTGEMISTFDAFDIDAFDAGAVTKIPDYTVHLRHCLSILRENSLFITDLSVVEDPARTYNVITATGNPTGKWTFGEMFRNMAGTSTTPKALAKSWLKHWIADFTLNGQVVQRRDDAIRLFIAPWLQKAGCTTTVSISNWNTCWDEADENELLINAPFKLTAIVNRLDLRGNSSYGLGISNSGETRFIFTLIDYSTGEPVLQPNVDQDPAHFIGYSVPRFIDWRGMNVIFEYGNVQTTRCNIKILAEQWVNLSSLGLGSNPYLEALEDITDYVTLANAAPKVNGSAINRIRTNEKIFHQMEPFAPPLTEQSSWAHADWEFRQFELDASSHLFKQVPLTNSVINYANTAYTMVDHTYRQEHRFSDPGPMLLYNGSMAGRTGSLGYPYSFGLQENLTDWLFNPLVKANLLRGSHNAPFTYRGNPFLAASTFDIGEFSHYWDYKWDATTEFYTEPASALAFSVEAQELRFQYSSNTCEGCHTGETKTIFTHVQPLGYGKRARYWRSIPDAQLDELDSRRTFSPSPPEHDNVAPYNYVFISELPPEPVRGAPGAVPYRYYQNVSAFLTGNRYSGTAAAPTYDDDNTSDADDNNMEGLFYVNDPSYMGGGKKHGFNDLVRRRDDLCNLVNSSCAVFNVIDLAANIKFVPLGLGAH